MGAGQSIRTGLLFEAAAGDTIASIARRFGRTAAEVAAVNPHAAALGVEPGTRVCVLPDVAGNDNCPPPGAATRLLPFKRHNLFELKSSALKSRCTFGSAIVESEMILIVPFCPALKPLVLAQ